MEKGTKTGLLIVTGVVIFGLFTTLSYTLFQDKLSPNLEKLHTKGLSKASSALNEVSSTEDFGGYVEDEDTYYLWYYKGSEKKVIIPKSFDGKSKVNTFGLFRGDEAGLNVEEVSFEKGFVWGDPNSFNILYQSNVKKFTTPINMGNVPSNSPLPKNLETLIVSEGTKSISPNAFGQAENLTSLTLPEGLETIGNNAFINAKSLKTIKLPSTIKSFTIGNGFADNTEFQFKKGTDISPFRNDNKQKNYSYTFYD